MDMTLELVVVPVRVGFTVDVDHSAGEDFRIVRLHPERVDFGTFATFQDPDGTGWLLQEVPSRAS